MTALCELCGEPIPEGEEMFKFHGYSGPCPKPPLPKQPEPLLVEAIRTSDKMPDPMRTVIVAGGAALWTGSVWLSQTGPDCGRVLAWRPEWWMPLMGGAMEPPPFPGARADGKCPTCGRVRCGP